MIVRLYHICMLVLLIDDEFYEKGIMIPSNTSAVDNSASQNGKFSALTYMIHLKYFQSHHKAIQIFDSEFQLRHQRRIIDSLPNRISIKQHMYDVIKNKNHQQHWPYMQRVKGILLISMTQKLCAVKDTSTGYAYINPI